MTLELSIGDYVLSGGEPVAAVPTDAVVRLLPGAIGDEQSADRQLPRRVARPSRYTRPANYNGWEVPEILGPVTTLLLRSGWKSKPTNDQARRPDLLKKI